MAFWRDVHETMLRAVVASSRTKTEALANLGFKQAGGNYAMLDMLIEQYGIDTSYKANLPGNKPSKSTGRFKGRPLADICVRNSTYTSTTSLKRRLLKEGVLERKCYVCGLTHWLGNIAPIGALRLDHINGTRTDNRIENLRIICAICDANTPTFCGRNKRATFKKLRPANPCIRCKKRPKFEDWRHCEQCLAYFREKRQDVKKSAGRSWTPRPAKPCPYCGGTFTPVQPSQKYCSRPCADASQRVSGRPSKETLLGLLKIHSWSAVGRMYGVSCNAIRKWVRVFGVDPKSLRPPRNPSPAHRPYETSRSRRDQNT